MESQGGRKRDRWLGRWKHSPSPKPRDNTEQHQAPNLSGSTLPVRPAPSTIVLPKNETTNKCSDPWSRALAKLPKADRDVLEELPKLTALEQLQDVVLKNRDACDKSQWKATVLGKEIVLRDVMQNISHVIDKFKGVGDVVANIDPMHVGLPWAGVRTLLQLAVSDSEQTAALLLGLEKTAHILSRCRIYELLYVDGQPLSEPQKTLTGSLEALYSEVLKFLVCALRTFRKTWPSRAIAAVNADSLVSFPQNCLELENGVFLDAENCERLHTRTHDTLLEGTVSQLKDVLKDLSGSVDHVHLNIETIFRIVVGERRGNILTWLSSEPYAGRHKYNIDRRTEGTGQWIFRKSEFLQWRDTNAPSALWLHGIPGAGKTMLCASVIEPLKEVTDASNNIGHVAYFYCDLNDSTRRDPLDILRSFVRQLVTDPDGSCVHQSAIRVYEERERDGFSGGSLDVKECKELLAEIIETRGPTVLIVDALDECERANRMSLVECLDAIAAKAKQTVKIFMTSRPDDDIVYHFRNGPYIKIEATDNANDIKKYVADRIAQSPASWRGRLSSQLLDDLCHVVSNKSDGMFMWAKTQMDHLISLKPLEKDIRARLEKLPPDMEKAYDEIWQRIMTQPGSGHTIAVQAFQWIACAALPLPPAVLVLAVNQDEGQSFVSSATFDIDYVLDVCCNLVAVDTETNTCRFAHLSIQEYLEGNHVELTEAHKMAATVCLSWLIHWPSLPTQAIETEYAICKLIFDARHTNPESKPLHHLFDRACREQSKMTQALNQLLYSRLCSAGVHHQQATISQCIGFLPLHAYAVRTWMFHVRSVGELKPDEHLRMILDHFLGLKTSFWSGACLFWIEYMEKTQSLSYVAKNGQGHPEWRGDNLLFDKTNSLFAVALSGLDIVLPEIWDQPGIDFNMRSIVGVTLLMLAAHNGHVHTVKNLLAHGANFDALILDKDLKFLLSRNTPHYVSEHLPLPVDDLSSYAKGDSRLDRCTNALDMACSCVLIDSTGQKDDQPEIITLLERSRKPARLESVRGLLDQGKISTAHRFLRSRLANRSQKLLDKDMWWAIENADATMLRWILEAGADSNARKDATRPLKWVLKRSTPSWFQYNFKYVAYSQELHRKKELLVEFGAQVDQK